MQNVLHIGRFTCQEHPDVTRREYYIKRSHHREHFVPYALIHVYLFESALLHNASTIQGYSIALAEVLGPKFSQQYASPLTVVERVGRLAHKLTRTSLCR